MTVRVSQLTTGVLGYSVSRLRASQLTAAVIGQITSKVRASQFVVAALIANLEPYELQTFPQLTGQGYSVVKRPTWNNNVQTAASGRQVRIGYYTQPIWEWDLLWEVLPDTGGVPGWSGSDIRTLQNFYNLMGGSLGEFQFIDPDDFATAISQFATGDGSTTTWTITRPLIPGGFQEPVGVVNTAAGVTVYLNGGVVTSSNYTINTTTPYAQTITFNSPPAAGAIVAISMQYYFVVRFKDDNYDFEKFANLLWEQKKMTLQSTRGT